ATSHCPATLSHEYTLTRPASTSSLTASSIWKRSTSSASPPAVGKSSTGLPNVPQRTTCTSWPRRSECQRDVSFMRSSSGPHGALGGLAPRRLAGGSGGRCGCGGARGRCDGRGRARLLAAPALDARPEQLGERIDLVRREQRLDLDPHRVARGVAAEE